MLPLELRKARGDENSSQEQTVPELGVAAGFRDCKLK